MSVFDQTLRVDAVDSASLPRTIPLLAEESAAGAIENPWSGLNFTTETELLESLGPFLSSICESLGYVTAGIFLLEPDCRSLTLRCQFPECEHTIPCAKRLVSEGEPDTQALLTSASEVWTDRNLQTLMPAELQFARCLSIVTRSGPLGTLWLYADHHRTAHPLEDHLLTAAAVKLGLMLERSVLLKESKEQARITRELRSAARSFVENFQWSDNRCEVASRCDSYYEMGGDLCETLSLNQRYLLLLSADVSGKCLSAAFLRSSLQGALRMAIRTLSDPLCTASLMAHLNRVVYDLSAAERFISCCVGLFDRVENQLQYTNAGHPQPLLITSGQTRELNIHGLVLGVVPDVDYPSDTISLNAGDLLAFFSDGITEVLSTDRELYGSQRVAALLSGSGRVPLTELRDRIYHSLAEHSQSEVIRDDHTLMLMRVLEDR